MDDLLTIVEKNNQLENVTLDFDALRNEGTAYIAQLGHRLWTDFNVHDPGITMLEVLCFAINDLAYRTTFPMQDLLAEPQPQYAQKQFFTASEILTNNAVTPLDYRKLMIDVDGVQNAWLFKAGERCTNLFRQYYLKYSKEEIQEILDYINQIPNTLPVAKSCCDFLKILDKNQLEYGNYGQLLCDLLTQKIDGRGKNSFLFRNDPLVISANLDTYENLFPAKEVVEIKANLIDFLGDPGILKETPIEGAYIFEKITDNKLQNYVNEILILLDCIPLPGLELRSVANLNGLRAYLTYIKDSLSRSEVFENFNKDELYRKLTNINPPNDIPDLARLLWDQLVCSLIVYLDPENLPNPLPERVALNGLYNVVLELEDRIDPNDTLRVNEISTAVRKKLNANRNLDEDFCDIEIVGVKPICIEANITVKDNSDVNDVMAKVLFHIQNFLSSRPQFYSLKEMFDRGLTSEEIFQGPILDHGFLDDEEVEQARLRRVIYKSDLYQEIMNVEGVEAITCLKIQLCRDSDRVQTYEDEWCLDICQKEQAAADKLKVQAPNDVQKYDARITCKCKPQLNIQSSKICFQKGGLKIPINQREVQEKLELLEILNLRLPIDDNKDLTPPAGNYRDLNDYHSIQEDFPLIYRIGKEQLPDSFSKERKAMVKQMKAYLTFFDQLLVNYLAQLRNLKNNLSVHSNPNDPVLATGSLLGLDPGIDELFFEVHQLNDETLKNLDGKLPIQILNELNALKILPPLQQKPFLTAVRKVVSVNMDDQMEEILLFHTKLPDFLAQQLAEIVENDLERYQRRNQILNHLIARFGERFTDYALSLHQSGPNDPCLASKITMKDNILQRKVEFLSSIPVIGSQRGKGFDYMNQDCPNEELFWITDNIVGMQKRVSRLLGLKHSGRVQLSCPPKVNVEKDLDSENKVFSFVVTGTSNKKKVVYLTSTKQFTVRGKGKRDLDKIRESLLNANRKAPNSKEYLFIAGNGPYYLQLQDTTANILAESLAFENEEDVKLFRQELLSRIFPDDCATEGFHVIEHILLRPISKSTPSLKSTDYCCCQDDECDPYSFWISVIALDNWERFAKDNGGRQFFEQMVRRETPAHIGIHFLWLAGEEMYRFEDAYKNWLYDLARLEADDCQIEDSLTTLVSIMNELMVKDMKNPCLEEEPLCCA